MRINAIMIDTHCHLYAKEFAEDIDTVIENAQQAGVSRFYLPAIDRQSLSSLLELESKFPGVCFAMTGLHPCSVKQNYREELHIISGLLEQRNFAAIGETGLDFYYDKTYVKEQYAALEMQIKLALKYKIPVVLHTRNAMQETIEVIQQHRGQGLTGIFHCFNGNSHEARQIIELGFYLGIGGVITYKNAGVAEVVQEISLEHIVLETDAPYLTPVPFRGKRNESAYVKYVAEKLALIKNVSVEEVDRITTANALKVFGSKETNL